MFLSLLFIHPYWIIYSIKFISPPLEEQKQIAEILSTVDNKLENLKCVFLHQKYLFDKNTESIESEDPYFLNGFSLYVGSLGAGYITFDEFDSLLKVPSNINTSEFSQTSYYNLLKKILCLSIACFAKFYYVNQLSQ